MKKILTLSAVALLAGVTFASAQTSREMQKPAESSATVERNPDGSTGGSTANPSPDAKGKVTGPRTVEPTGQQSQRDSMGRVGGSKGHPSPNAKGTVSGPRTNEPTGQQSQRGPMGRTGGSESNPSPR